MFLFVVSFYQDFFSNAAGVPIFLTIPTDFRFSPVGQSRLVIGRVKNFARIAQSLYMGTEGSFRIRFAPHASGLRPLELNKLINRLGPQARGAPSKGVKPRLEGVARRRLKALRRTAWKRLYGRFWVLIEKK